MFTADGSNVRSIHRQYCNKLQGLYITYGCNFTSNLWGKSFFIGYFLNGENNLLKCFTTSLDTKLLFLCPLFVIILNTEGLRVLFVEN